MPASRYHSIQKLLNTRVVAYTLIALIVIYLHFPSLKTPLYTEDYSFIIHAKTCCNLYDVFIAQFLGSKLFFSHFYRPLTQNVLFYISYTLFDLNPIGYRLIVFALFIVCNFLLYEITFAITKRNGIALTAAVFYATRLAFVESINWVSAGIQNWGMNFNFLFCILCYLYFIQKNKKLYYSISIISFVLALLSRENSVVLPFIIILMEVVLRKSKVKHILRRVSPFVMLDLIFLLRFYIMQTRYPVGNYNVVFSAEVFLGKLLYYSKWCFNSPVDATVIIVALIPGIIFLLSRKEKNLIMFSVGWFLIGLLPFLGLATVPSGKYPTYYLDIALLGFSLLISAGMIYYYKTFPRAKYIVALLVFGVVIFSAALDIRKKVEQIHQQQKTYISLLSCLETSFPKFPDNSLLYIRGRDLRDLRRIYYLLGSGDAISLHYDNVSFYFEGLDNQLPSEYSQIYFIDVNEDSIKVSEPSDRGTSKTTEKDFKGM